MSKLVFPRIDDWASAFIYPDKSKIPILFGWLDKNNEILITDSADSCRGIFTSQWYSDFKNTHYLTLRPANSNFEFNRDFLSAILCFKPEDFDEIQKRIEKLNEFAKIFGSTDLFAIQQLDWEMYTPEWRSIKNYKLTGPRVFMSSGAIISFWSGMLKFGFINNDNFLGLSSNIEKFVEKYSKSCLCTENLEDIKKEYEKNYDTDNSLGLPFSSIRQTHDLGAEYFLQNKWPASAYLPRAN